MKDKFSVPRPPYKCKYCRTKITGAVLFLGGRKCAHPYCEAQHNPFVPKETFDQVLNNIDDQVLVRELLRRFVPDFPKAQIVKAFNDEMTKRDEFRRKEPA